MTKQRKNRILNEIEAFMNKNNIGFYGSIQLVDIRGKSAPKVETEEDRTGLWLKATNRPSMC